MTRPCAALAGSGSMHSYPLAAGFPATYAHTQARTRPHTHTPTHVHMHPCTHAPTHLSTHHAHKHTQAHAHAHTHAPCGKIAWLSWESVSARLFGVSAKAQATPQAQKIVTCSADGMLGSRLLAPALRPQFIVDYKHIDCCTCRSCMREAIA